MATDVGPAHRTGIHPVHACLLAGTIPLFLGALLSDWAYARSYEVQWTNFASWLIAGALLFAGLALLWSALSAVKKGLRRDRRAWLPFALLAATFLLGFVNALVHAKDAWAAMPDGLILSAIVFLLALASTWAAFASPARPARTGDAR